MVNRRVGKNFIFIIRTDKVNPECTIFCEFVCIFMKNGYLDDMNIFLKDESDEDEDWMDVAFEVTFPH